MAGAGAVAAVGDGGEGAVSSLALGREGEGHLSVAPGGSAARTDNSARAGPRVDVERHVGPAERSQRRGIGGRHGDGRAVVGALADRRPVGDAHRHTGKGTDGDRRRTADAVLCGGDGARA